MQIEELTFLGRPAHVDIDQLRALARRLGEEFCDEAEVAPHQREELIERVMDSVMTPIIDLIVTLYGVQGE